MRLDDAPLTFAPEWKVETVDDLHWRANDLSGERFGRLVALRPTTARKARTIKWLCVCICGTLTLPDTNSLQSGNTKSCGCLHSEVVSERMRVDIAGERYGRLTAIEPLNERLRGSIVWRCRCDCGETTTVTARRLRVGDTRSCGCLQREHAASIAHLGGSSYKDLSGQRFGRLVAVEAAEERSGGRVVWLCECDCGETTKANSNALNSGDKRSCGCLWEEAMAALSGPDNPAWRGGVTTEHKTLRASTRYAEWRSEILDRDGRQCRKCGVSWDLNAHHVIAFADLYDGEDADEILADDDHLLWNVGLGVTLCEDCHRRFHAVFGRTGFDGSDLRTFLDVVPLETDLEREKTG